MKFFVTILIIALTSSAIDAKIYSKCEFARAMRSHGYSMASLPDWVCLVRHESSFNSNVVGPFNSNGSHDYGIFQINDRYWCKVGYAGGDCNIDCNRLKNDDINDDITCTKKIFGRHGYSAWYGWINNCKGRNLGAYQVNECF